MKVRNILAALLLMVAGLQTALAQKVVLHKTNGETIEYDVSELDSIVFKDKVEFPISMTCPDSNHPHAIDLGLPSGTKWCCCNVGAEMPESVGGYFAWGETDEKSEYDDVSYIFLNGQDTDGDGRIDQDGSYIDIGIDDIAGTDYDVAYVRMGDSWCMPSKAQQDELRDNCSIRGIQQNGVNGILVTGPNGGRIFMPSTGYYWKDHFYDDGGYGGYWSSSRIRTEPLYVYSMVFNTKDNHGFWDWDASRCSYGRSVRPVRVEEKVNVNINANTSIIQDVYTEETTSSAVRTAAPLGMEIPSLNTGDIDALIIHTLPDGVLNYCVGYNTKLKANCWTAYKWYNGFSSNDKNWYRNNWRQGETFNGYGGTSDPFQPDPVLPADLRIYSEDYNNSGYQRGHMLGSADRLNSKEANGQTFYLSNIHPQLAGFNGQGIWWNLEDHLRSTYDTSSFRDTLYVVKGGTISAGNYTMVGNSSQLACPKYFFMAILAYAKKYAKTNGGYYAIAFWMEHEENTDEVISKYAITIDELEKRTGIDFFCNLPDDIEDEVESHFYLADWKLK